MATVMTSRRYDAPPPPLPSRTGHPVQRSQSSVESSQNAPRHTQGRKSSYDNTPPPLPPVDQSRQPMNTPGGGGGGRRFGDGFRTDKPAPPLPNRNASNEGHPPQIRRKSFETNSFINRHTARAYSNPNDTSITSDEYTPPPPPPSTKTIPKRNGEHRMRDVYDAEDPYAQRKNNHTQNKDKPPDLPPARLPNTNAINSSVNEFERRFQFHDVKDFPTPEQLECTRKNYPSLNESIRVKKSSSASSPRDHLGPL